MKYTTQILNISNIVVSSRIRKDTGGIDDLATDIKEHGLINPVSVMDCGDGSFQLIAGLRRLKACKSLGHTEIRTSVLSPIAADELLKMEYAENVQRLDFSIAERLEYAQKIKAVEQAKARERKAMYARDGYRNRNQVPAIWPEPERGETRDFVAEKSGFSSTTQMRRAVVVAAECPELLDKIDAGETTIYRAYKQVVNGLIAPLPKNEISAPPSIYKRIRQSTDAISHAKHDRLMNNPLYAKLFADVQETRQDANRARAELDRKTAFYTNQVKHFESNIEALKRQRDELIAENAELRAQLQNISNLEV